LKLPEAPSALGLYVHVPFCTTRCPYCVYGVSPVGSVAPDAFVAALHAEADRSLPRDARFSTVLVGGGTPTTLPARSFVALLAFIAARRAAPEGEWTVEANPETLSEGVLQAARDAGVNRISIGAQSLSDTELGRIGRGHTRRVALEALDRAMDAGFRSVSVDILTGIDGQSPASLERTIAEIGERGVHHVEVFGLDPGEPGAANEPEWTGTERRRFLVERLSAAGYEGYELTAFALPGHAGIHRSDRCAGAPYHALGPWSASYVDGLRQVRRGGAADYVESVSRETSLIEHEERVTGVDAAAERLFLGLHLRAGVPEGRIPGELAERVSALVQQGWLEFASTRRPGEKPDARSLRLTAQGWLDPDEALGLVLDPSLDG